MADNGLPVIADGRIRLRRLKDAPADPDAITVEEFNAATKFENRVLKTDYALGPTGSDTVPDQFLDAKGNVQVPGSSNVAGSLTVVRFLDEDGQPDSEGDTAFTAMKEKGAVHHFVETSGPESTKDGVVGDEYSYFKMFSDEPQPPQSREGYIKSTVPLLYAGDHALHKTLVGGEEGND